jgi:hypothetical protein
VSRAKRALNKFLEDWVPEFGLTVNEQVCLLAGEIASLTHCEIKKEREAVEQARLAQAVDLSANLKGVLAEYGPRPAEPIRMTPKTKCIGMMTEREKATCTEMRIEPEVCCDRAGEYNGFASGPTSFTCPNHCSCHD